MTWPDISDPRDWDCKLMKFHLNERIRFLIAARNRFDDKARTTGDIRQLVYVLITRLSREEIQRDRLSNLITISTSSRVITYLAKWFRFVHETTRLHDRISITETHYYYYYYTDAMKFAIPIASGESRYYDLRVQFRFCQADLTNARGRLLFGSRSERMIDYSYNYSCRKVLPFCAKPA
jgi:hypothetical protein